MWSTSALRTDQARRVLQRHARRAIAPAAGRRALPGLDHRRSAAVGRHVQDDGGPRRRLAAHVVVDDLDDAASGPCRRHRHRRTGGRAGLDVGDDSRPGRGAAALFKPHPREADVCTVAGDSARSPSGPFHKLRDAGGLAWPTTRTWPTGSGSAYASTEAVPTRRCSAAWRSCSRPHALRRRRTPSWSGSAPRAPAAPWASPRPAMDFTGRPMKGMVFVDPAACTARRSAVGRRRGSLRPYPAAQGRPQAPVTSRKACGRQPGPGRSGHTRSVRDPGQALLRGHLTCDGADVLDCPVQSAVSMGACRVSREPGAGAPAGSGS